MKSNRLSCLGLASLLTATCALSWGKDIYVAPGGIDSNAGTISAPFASLTRARDEARRFAGKEAVNILLRGGTYYLAQTLVFTAGDSGTKDFPIVYAAVPGEQAVISGARRLQLDWKAGKGGIMEAAIPAGISFSVLYVNGQRQDLARYPNRIPGMPVLGCFPSIDVKEALASLREDALAPARIARWSDPAGGYIRGLQGSLYGSTDARILGKNTDGTLNLQFVTDARDSWQSAIASEKGLRPYSNLHPVFRYVEGIAEELDAPGEWFLDSRKHVLRFIPPQGLDLNRATVEAAQLERLVEFTGTQSAPVRFISLRGLTFQHSAPGFMNFREPLALSDWLIYRDGAVFFDGAEDCSLEDSVLTQLGGTAVFINKYNRRVTVRGCHIHACGGGGVNLIGDPEAIWGPRKWGQKSDIWAVDLAPGAKTDNYPADCLIDDCLIENLGLEEKQIAGVDIDIAARITVRHCSIYDVPRAGINIGTGYFGGHLVDGCDIFDTVQETHDHGSFNSWGRSRYWWTEGGTPQQLRTLAKLDAVEPTTLRNSRWRCDHGWDIDLDDGSSNFIITDNLLLQGGLKLREGFYREATNNVIVNNTLHPHVWYPNSEDVFEHNIVFGAYQPAGGMPITRWGRAVGQNLFTSSEGDRQRFASVGCDLNSVVADPLFVDPAAGDFRVREGSPALALGFRNFPMDQFGVQKPALRLLARSPVIPSVLIHPDLRPVDPAKIERKITWYGASIRDLGGEEFSAYGVTKESGGIVVLAVGPRSPAAKFGLRPNDLIRSVNDQPIAGIAGLEKFLDGVSDEAPLRVGILHANQASEILITPGRPEPLKL